jgi:Type VI secretion system, TssN
MQISTSQLQQVMPRQAGYSWSITVTAKQTILYSAAVVLLSAALSYLFAAMEIKRLPSAGALYLFVIMFWSVGIAHIFIFPPLLVLLHSKKGLIFSSLLAVLLCAAVWMVFYVTGFDAKQLAITAGVAFLLPHLLEQGIDFYYRIPLPAQYQAWVIPQDATPDTRMSLLLNSIHFRVKLKVKADDMQSVLFTVNLGERLTLSTVFLRFLYDQHNAIEIADNRLRPYGWRFSVKRRFGNITMLNPERSLKENGVREGDVILIERAPATSGSQWENGDQRSIF